MNKWQIFWRSIDEARLIVRVILFVGFYFVFKYLWFVSAKFFGIIDIAQQNDDPQWSAMVPILTAVTAFAAANVKVIVDLVTKVYLDYRKSSSVLHSNGGNEPEE